MADAGVKRIDATDPSAVVRRPGRDLLILCLTTLVLLLRFIARPLHVDDPLFVWTARQIVSHPLDFYGFAVNWSGHPIPMASEMLNPPLLPFYLAVATRLFGAGEIVWHLSLLPISLLAVIGMYTLAGNYCRSPLPATLMLLLSPAFLVSATTIMCDVPMLCLWLWTMVFWIRGHTRSAWWLPLGAFLAGLAILTKFSAITLLPLLLILQTFPSLSGRSKHRMRACASLLIPLVMVGLYNHFTLIHYGQGQFMAAIGFSSKFTEHIGLRAHARFFDGVIFLGGSALTAALVGFTLLRPRWQIAVMMLILPAIWAARKWFDLPESWASPWPFCIQAAFFTAAGAALVLVCCGQLGRRSPRRVDAVFLLLWIAGVFIFAVKFNWAINARTLLPLLPPVCILTQRAWEAQREKRHRASVMAFFLAAAIAVLCAVADDSLAIANRNAAAAVMQKYKGRTIWFTGHWGFQYYMQALGARPLNIDTPACRNNDLIIVPMNSYAGPPRNINMLGGDAVVVDTLPCLTLLNRQYGGGFYFSAGESLPFVFGFIRPEWYMVETVRD